MLRGKTIIDGYDRTRDLVGKAATYFFVGIQVADHPATAMKEDQYRKRSISFWSIYSDRNFSTLNGNGAVFDVGNGLWCAKHRQPQLHALTHSFGSLCVHLGLVERRQLLQ